MAGQDTLGEAVALLVMMVAPGARTEATEIPPYVMVVGLEEPAPTSKYPPSPFPPLLFPFPFP